jgi:CRISPR system Cascade subunit CasE
MWLYRVHLNPRCKEARRDLADPYQMHATLCRAYFPKETRCPPGALLWRLEPESDARGRPRVLIQSQATPDWQDLVKSDWLAQADPGIAVAQKLALDSLAVGREFRFRLRANPCKTANGKRTGLVHPEAQLAWLVRKGDQHGFALPAPNTPDSFEFVESVGGEACANVRISQHQMLVGRRNDGSTIRVFSVLFEGRLRVSDPRRFKATLASGIGHGKVMGLGLLSVAPQSK